MKGTFLQMGLIGMLLVLAVFITGVAADEELCIPLGTIELMAPSDVEATRSAVAFPHSQHFDINCKTCHHEWSGDETDTLSCSTSGCHDYTEMPSDKSEAILYYKNAFHKSCIGCHKAIKTENRRKEMTNLPVSGALAKTGPTSCNGCHPK
jgi:hypothetical protein